MFKDLAIDERFKMAEGVKYGYSITDSYKIKYSLSVLPMTS
jgi:hypothetical protein